MNLQFQKVTKKFLQQNEGHLPLVPYYTNQGNKYVCIHSFPLLLITYELIRHSTQLSQHYHKT
jgi:hypothetical protein